MLGKFLKDITLFQVIIETIVLIVEVGGLFQKKTFQEKQVLFGCIGNVWAVFQNFLEINSSNDK
jgi:hypothetical protein